MRDLRCTEQYLGEEERKKWSDRNILYNTLWFADQFTKNKKDAGLKVRARIEVEHSEEAIEGYKKLRFYKDCDKELAVSWSDGSKKEITADIMTGWWNPFKYFLKLQSRNDIQMLLDKYEERLECMSGEKVPKWMSETFGRDETACAECLEFLKVVYTDGNMIPIISNFCPGSTLDGWDTKMLRLMEPDDYTSNQAKEWGEYVRNVFGNVENFIEENKLENYLCGGEVDLFWDRTKKFGYKEAEDREWKGYFEKAKNKIICRNERLDALDGE